MPGEVDLLRLTAAGAVRERQGGARSAREEVPPASAGTLASNFTKLLDEKIRTLDGIQQKSLEMNVRFAAGDPSIEIHDVTIASAKASLAMEVALQFRTLALRTVERLVNLR